MAKFLSINKKFFLKLTFCFISLFCFAQEVSQERVVRFSVWAMADNFPGIDVEHDDFLTVPVSKIKKIAPFFVQSMVYGWKFDYTPSDKARGVKEFFEFTPVTELTDSEINSIKYAKPWSDDSKIWVWAEFNRTPEQIHLFKSWMAILNPRIKGVGYAKLSDGFEGIQSASKEALKEAVREFERRIIKTKPKQITGTVLMSGPPLIGIDAGRYRVTLEFFMETDKIIEYKTF